MRELVNFNNFFKNS